MSWGNFRFSTRDIQTTRDINLRHCSRCKQSKPPTEFSKDKYGPAGLLRRCKACDSAYYRTRPKRVR